MSKKKEITVPKKKKRPVGRPFVYDPMAIAQELLAWSKQDDAINIAKFCAQHGYLPALIWRYENEFPEFQEAMILTKLTLAARREELLNADLLNYGAYQRYQAGYDPFLRKDEDAEKDKDAKRKQGIAEKETQNLATLIKMAAKGHLTQKD